MYSRLRGGCQAVARGEASANLNFHSQWGDGLTKGAALATWRKQLQTTSQITNNQTWGGDVRARPVPPALACSGGLPYPSRLRPLPPSLEIWCAQEKRPMSALKAERFFAWVKREQLYYKDLVAPVRARARECCDACACGPPGAPPQLAACHRAHSPFPVRQRWCIAPI